MALGTSPAGDGAAYPEVGTAPPAPPDPLRLSDLTRGWVDAPPLVSVVCITYQHAGFIDDALAGFLAQRTEFPFEVIIRDDASTDGTAERVADWADRYPGVVRAFLEPVNSSVVRAAGTARPPDLLRRARGALLAWCEGDDYWTDPTKLATQARILDERPDAAASHHDQITVRDGLVVGEPLLTELRRDRTAAELLAGKTLPLRSLMHRNDPRIVDIPGRVVEGVWNADRLLTARIGLVGGSVFAAGIGPAVYRRHEGGVSTLLAADPARRAVVKSRSYFWIAVDLAGQGRSRAAESHLERAVGHLVAGGAALGVDPRLRLGMRLIRDGLRAAGARSRPVSLLRRMLPGVRRRSGG